MELTSVENVIISLCARPLVDRFEVDCGVRLDGVKTQSPSRPVFLSRLAIRSDVDGGRVVYIRRVLFHEGNPTKKC